MQKIPKQEYTAEFKEQAVKPYKHPEALARSVATLRRVLDEEVLGYRDTCRRFGGDFTLL